ncbi:hypothetical protein DXC08_06560 [Clostridium sp. OM07-9AC]|nr:hypothetical protein DXC08_06560 [Clostridium sp. OM07-9AC]
MDETGNISISGDDRFKDAFVSTVYGWDNDAKAMADLTRLSIDFTKINMDGISDPFVVVKSADGTSMDYMGYSGEKYQDLGNYSYWTKEFSCKPSELSSLKEGAVGITLPSAKVITVEVYNPAAKPTIDTTAYDGKTLQVGKNIFEADLKLPVDGQSIQDTYIQVQMQGGENWSDWSSIGQSETTYDADSGKLITTITLTEEQLATIKDANEKSTADNTLYKLAVNVQIKLSDGSTIYSVIDQKYSFNIAE